MLCVTVGRGCSFLPPPNQAVPSKQDPSVLCIQGEAKSKANSGFLLLVANKNLASELASFAEIRYPSNKQVLKAGGELCFFLLSSFSSFKRGPLL